MRWYTAYDRKSDKIVACGPAQQVADALGMNLNSFYCAVSRSSTGKQRKYTFVVEQIDEDEFKKEYEP